MIKNYKYETLQVHTENYEIRLHEKSKSLRKNRLACGSQQASVKAGETTARQTGTQSRRRQPHIRHRGHMSPVSRVWGPVCAWFSSCGHAKHSGAHICFLLFTFNVIANCPLSEHSFTEQIASPLTPPQAGIILTSHFYKSCISQLFS